MRAARPDARAASSLTPARPFTVRLSGRRLALLAGLLVAAAPKAATAQLLERYYPAGIPGYQDWFADTVLSRPRSEYTPLGIRLGDFTINPNLSQGFGYDSNILSASHPLGSAFSETSGTLTGHSGWARDSLAADLTVDNVSYFQHSQASYTNWTAAIGGTVDIGRDQAALSYAHYNLTNLPNQIGVIGIGQPSTYQADDMRASYWIDLGQVTVVPALEATLYRYQNVLSDGVLLNQTANNRNAVTGSVTSGYRLAPGQSLVFVVSDTSSDSTDTPPGAPKQNFNDVSVLGGIDEQPTGALRYRLLLGYEQRDYASAQLGSLAAPASEFDVTWTPSLLTTVTGRISSSLQSPTTTGASGYTYTDARLVVDHEYLRNVLLKGYGEYQRASYHASNTIQNTFYAGASITWLINRTMSASANYQYSLGRSSPDAGTNNTGSAAFLQVSFHL